MESSPGCWATFGRVLAREYSDPQFFETHRLTVDSYAVQHPGRPSRQSIQSVGVHLVRLCLFIEHELAPEEANSAMLAAARRKSEYFWLEPPASLGVLTVADDEIAIGIRHIEAVDHHQRADGHIDAGTAKAQHLWQMRVRERQLAFDLVVGLVECPTGDEDAYHGAGLIRPHLHYRWSRPIASSEA